MTAMEEAATKVHNRPRPTTTTATVSHATSLTFAPAPARNQQHPAPPKKIVNNPLSPHHPARLIVQVLPEGVKPDDRPDPTKLVKDINARLAANADSKHLIVVSTKWNAHGNCIILTHLDQTGAGLAKYLRLFVDLIAPGHDTIVR
ncbi:hypothetical protein B0H17DRAFT_1212563 [Mycena rosella]|uniref:Uncharacterized protein n=1 Tax=Mycena rosella TaxID=1033263 RepID=A0AAD7CS67_MYCRO|nr:hypothetical protein B0H17DRAFT_1212563 [Mycena rosella]